MMDFQLGQRVRYSEHIQRRHNYNRKGEPNRQWTGEAYPGKRFDGGEGIIVGKRTLSDGYFDYGYVEAGTYAPVRHFTAWLVAFDLHRKPVHVLLENITAVDS